jgi:hypothetical protein
MATRRLKRPRDPIQLGKLIVEAFADNQMLSSKVWFALDSPLGEVGFEPSVPPCVRGGAFRGCPFGTSWCAAA